MITIIDYGMGNLHSVQKAFAKLGCEVEITRQPGTLLRAKKVVLPGVGAFGDAMDNLNNYGLIEVIKQIITRQTPFLGICLGLQLLFEESEEAPGVPGLGLMRGKIKKIPAAGLKVPHMGWNSLEFCTPSPLFTGLAADSYVYFVHSYYAAASDAENITAVTPYGQSLTAAVGNGNLQAVQFHPEKSGTVGLQILQNFKEMV